MAWHFCVGGQKAGGFSAVLWCVVVNDRAVKVVVNV